VNDIAPELDVDDLAYSKQFFTITRQGHTRPTPEFGTPTLVWHIGFWPQLDSDPQTIDAGGLSSIGPTAENFRSFEVKLRLERAVRRQRLIENFNALLRDLQMQARTWRSTNDGTLVPQIDQFELSTPADWYASTKGWDDPAFLGTPLPVLKTESIGFTLWWNTKMDEPLSARVDKRPRPDDLRIRVQANIHADYSTISVYIDVGKSWMQTPSYSNAILQAGEWRELADRRGKIISAVAHIKQICETRTNSPLVRKANTPEPDPMPAFQDDAESLKVYADFLYEEVWDEFCRGFGFSLQRIVGKTDKVFANSRGLVLSTRGTGEPLDRALTEAVEGDRPHRFDVVEANAVLEGYWPFLRRLRPEADYRDWIACGVFDWRALYVSSLGAQSQFSDQDEGDIAFDVPAGALPKGRVRGLDPANEPDWSDLRFSDAPTSYYGERPAPTRHLFLTKYEPHRKQIGRLVERVNALETLRLYAFKHWSIIRDTDEQIGLFGQELDACMKVWASDMSATNIRFEAKAAQVADGQSELLRRYLQSARNKIPKGSVTRIEAAITSFADHPALNLRALADEVDRPLFDAESGAWTVDLKRLLDALQRQWSDLYEDWDRSLVVQNRLAESRLVAIGVGLSQINSAATGGVLSWISRAKFHIDVFRTLSQTLRISVIETWTSYSQFITRDLEPSFQFIETTGARLANLQLRLHNEMQSIQNSAIVNHAEATRNNTSQLSIVLREVQRLLMFGQEESMVAQNKMVWWRRAAGIVAIAGAILGVAGKWIIEYWWKMGWWPF
jgi:hypothetical protein